MASQVDAVRVEEVVKTVQIVLYGLTIALGSVGNALVVWVIGARLKPTATNVCLLNLAVADLVFSISRVLSVSYLSLDHWLFGLALCQFNGLLKYANMFCSVFLLVVISLDRALCVQRPIQAKSLRTVGRARAINVAVWVAAVVLSLPYSISRTVVVKEDSGSSGGVNATKCSMEAVRSVGVRTCLYLVRFLFGFLLPFLVIAGCYVLTACGLRRTHIRRKVKVIRLLVMLVTAFFLCWAPYHFLLLVKMVRKESRWVKLGLPVAQGLSHFNSCVNPILYFCMGLERRRGFRRSISGALRKTLEDDGMAPVTEGQQSASIIADVQLKQYQGTIQNANNDKL
ncbi:C3a anaphylatoxin chemotactic receptor-like [Engraulis encrasicolus]|uniref:C3a anaphylatoxin chemotactic receptor-like n=1 Tax=Engraulis encrasicolus TaxID=184585 RepID=UPI002FD48F6F